MLKYNEVEGSSMKESNYWMNVWKEITQNNRDLMESGERTPLEAGSISTVILQEMSPQLADNYEKITVQQVIDIYNKARSL